MKVDEPREERRGGQGEALGGLVPGARLLDRQDRLDAALRDDDGGVLKNSAARSDGNDPAGLDQGVGLEAGAPVEKRNG